MPISFSVLISSAIFSLSVVLFGPAAWALQCRDLFQDHVFENFDQIQLKKKEKRHLQQVLLEETIRRHMEGQKTQMSADEISQIRSEARKFDAELDRIHFRIKSAYKIMNGSKRNRIQDEAETEIMGKTNKLLLGSVDEVYESLARDFSQYEKNYLLALTLRTEIYQLNFKKPVPTDVIQAKLKSLQELDKYIGENIFIYLELRESLVHLTNQGNPEAASLSHKLLQRLQSDSAVLAKKNILEYRDISIEEIKMYLRTSSIAEKASVKRAAVREFVTMLKMLTLSGPIVKAVKWLVYQIPEKISIMKFQDIPLRKMVAKTFGLGEVQMFKGVYMSSMNSILEQRGSPAKQYELMKSANTLSIEKDEFMVVFARVPENQKDWIAIRDYSETIADQNEFNRDLHDRILAAQKKAIEEKELPLYENEAGATVVGRIAVTSAIGYYFMNKYFGDNPEAALSQVENVQSILRFFIF